MLMRLVTLGLLLGLVSPALAAPPGLRFTIKLDPTVEPKEPVTGRLLVGIGPANGRPNFTATDPPLLPILGTDAIGFTSKKSMVIDRTAMTFPENGFDQLPPGEYSVLAVFAFQKDIDLPLAPGNLTSKLTKVTLDPKADREVVLTLTETVPERMPKETATHKFLKIPSKKLSEFYGRPMVYRVGVVLPPKFEQEPNRKYPLIVHIGGFGSRYTGAQFIRPDDRFLQILLDGAGPLGDPYQVDSANHGPYGAALTEEVIPYIEATYRGRGTPQSRFTTGGSTGGWVSLALQLFYPDYFNGCWSQCPDSLDFRSYELINIYQDRNAYVNAGGFERPAKRTIDGDTIYSVRHECRIERVLGLGGRWELSGRDWASWNATYGPRGADGKPVPLWNGETGVIDRSVLDHWKKYDLRLYLESNWPTIGPKLAGKIHIWVGDADDYFLNNGVHRFKASALKLKNPTFDGTILIEPRKGHTSGGWTREEMHEAMLRRADKAP